MNLTDAIAATIGGLLIGFASIINLYIRGKITGMSGTFNGIIFRRPGLEENLSLLCGLLATSSIAFLIFGFDKVTDGLYLFDSPEQFKNNLGISTLFIAGALVGYGTNLGNGCTSGHGVCGLPRFSFRSFVAVITFMTTGIIMANVSDRLFEHEPASKSLEAIDPTFVVVGTLALSVIIMLVNIARSKFAAKEFIQLIVSFVVGCIFSLGLLISGMSRRSKVLGFLTFNKDWDPSLMFVMGGAVLLNLYPYHYIINIKKKSALGDSLSVPTSKIVDWKLIFGAALFGLGWGLGGLCPGPAMIVSPVYFFVMIVFILGMLTGTMSAESAKNMLQKAKVQ